MDFHPLANAFPLMEGDKFEALVADIKANGLRYDIETHDGMILDGRNRHRACLAAGVKPRFKAITGDPLTAVISLNLMRREMTPAQRAMAAAKMANMPVGRPKKEITGAPVINGDGSEQPLLTQDQAAKKFGVHHDTVLCAKKVLEFGTAEEVAAVERGEIGLKSLGRTVRKTSASKRKSARKQKVTQRAENQRLNGQIWKNLSSALNGLTNLPLASDVAEVIATHSKRKSAVDAKLTTALKWMEDFSHAWTAHN